MVWSWSELVDFEKTKVAANEHCCVSPFCLEVDVLRAGKGERMEQKERALWTWSIGKV